MELVQHVAPTRCTKPHSLQQERTLKFQTATVRCLKVRNSWFSYRKMKAVGVICSVSFTSTRCPCRTSSTCVSVGNSQARRAFAART